MRLKRVGTYDSRQFYKKENFSPERRVKHYEVELFSADSGECYINGVGYPIQKGWLLTAKPGQVRYSKLPFRTYFLHFTAQDNLTISLLNAMPSLMRVSDYGRYHQLIEDIAAYKNTSEPSGVLMVHSLLYRLLYLMDSDRRNTALQHSKSHMANMELMHRIADYMENHFRENLDLAELALQANLSPVYFHRQFKQCMGLTPHDYLLQKRLSHAKVLLVTTDLTITQLSYECGFGSQSYFTTCFKRLCGMTPLSYRRSNADSYMG